MARNVIALAALTALRGFWDEAGGRRGYVSPEATFLVGLAAAGDLLLKPTEQYMNDFLFRVYQGTVKLMPSGLETGASAILGAAALIWSELKL